MPPKTTIKKKILKEVKKEVKREKQPKTAVAMIPIKGRGDYRPTRFQRVSGRGDYLGDLFGSLGGKLGNGIQGAFRDITGFGDYRTNGPSRNSLVRMVERARDTNAVASANLGSAPPSQNPFEMGAMSVTFSGKAPRIQHREFIGSIRVPATNASSFNTTVYPIQPGLQGSNTLFPWGSSVFGNFENYIMHGMVLEYVSTSSNFSSSSALGSVSMSTVYDAEANPLATLAEVNNNEFTTSAPPCTSFYHPIECSPAKGATDVKFVRKTNTSTSGDSRFDDVGLFQISTSGLTAPAGTEIGQLWASWDIECLKSVLPDIHAGTTALWDASAATLGALFLSPIANPENSLPAVLTGVQNSATSTTFTIQMPAQYNGNYMVVLAGASTGTYTGLTVSNTPTIGSDITLLPLLPQGSTPSSVSGFQLIGASTYIALCTFSTIAENKVAADNRLSFLVQTSSQTANSVANVFVIPIDNDVREAAYGVQKLLRKNPDLAAFASLLSRQQAALPPAPALTPREPEPCDFSSRDEWLTYLAAREVLPPSPPRLHTGKAPVVAASSAPRGELSSEDNMDKWDDVAAHAPSAPPATPESSVPTQPGGAQSTAQAEQALADAIKAAAAARRRELTEPARNWFLR